MDAPFAYEGLIIHKFGISHNTMLTTITERLLQTYDSKKSKISDAVYTVNSAGTLPNFFRNQK